MKQYVGITNNPDRRWSEHCRGEGSKLVYQAIKKYEKENFEFEILFEGHEEEIKNLEVKIIATLETMVPYGYNLTAGGEGKFGCKATKETKRKLSKATRGLNNPMYGKKHSLETRKKQSEKAKQRSKESRIGNKHSLKTRQKLSQIAKQRVTPHHATRVEVNNIKYDSLTNASKDQHISYPTLKKQFQRYSRSGLWPNGFRFL